MDYLFLVNDVHRIEPTQTTAMLMAAAARRHRVWVTDVGQLSGHPDGQLRTQAKRVAQSDRLAQLTGAIAAEPWASLPLNRFDRLIIRTNPARDLPRAPLHQSALAIARLAEDLGITVINRPDGLIRAASKLYLLEMPAFTRPPTLVSQRREEIVAFLGSLGGPGVLKPIQGTRGNDVFFVASAADKNLNQIIGVVSRQGMVMAQGCIPGAEAGDTRVVVLKGEILAIAGKPAAIRRVPGSGDFRSNIHAGGRAEPGEVTPGMAQVVAAIGPKLVSDGLWLVGLDFIGDLLVEINVFSTGGLRDAERYTSAAFAEQVIAAFDQLAKR